MENLCKDLMVVGYYGEYLVAMDEKDILYAKKESDRIFEPGMVCDNDMMFVSFNMLEEKTLRHIEKLMCGVRV